MNRMENLFKKVAHIDTFILLILLTLIWSCGGDSEEIITPPAPKLGEFVQDDTYTDEKKPVFY